MAEHKALHRAMARAVIRRCAPGPRAPLSLTHSPPTMTAISYRSDDCTLTIASAPPHHYATGVDAIDPRAFRGG